jgi:hypothetical protein
LNFKNLDVTVVISNYKDFCAEKMNKKNRRLAAVQGIFRYRRRRSAEPNLFFFFGGGALFGTFIGGARRGLSRRTPLIRTHISLSLLNLRHRSK